MEEAPKYVVGIDVGTEVVRGVMATVGREGLVVVGYGEEMNSGMRKGELVTLAGSATAVDKVLGQMERMSGLEVRSVVVSINGVNVQSMNVEGMIVAGDVSHEITEGDLARMEETALMGRLPQNREVLDMIPFEYVIDGQRGIRAPIGMRGARLEMRANVVSALAPNCADMRKMLEEMVEVRVQRLVPTAVAAGKAVLTEKQMEYGVAVVDFGAATTSVAVFECGDLQCTFVIPMGSDTVTRDLANVLGTDMSTADEVKRRFVTGVFDSEGKDIVMKKGREEVTFEREVVDANARARLVEIFEKVREGIVQAGYGWNLPEGVVITGGGARMRGIEVLAKEVLGTAAKIGVPAKAGMPGGLSGVAEAVAKPEYAVVVGLLMMGNENFEAEVARGGSGKKKEGVLARIFGKF